MNLLDRAIGLTLPFVPKPIVHIFAKPYIAGTTMEEAFGVVRDLATQGAMSTLDILGEFVSTPEAAAANTQAYESLIERVHAERLADTHISVKLSALGLLIDRELCLNNTRRLVEKTQATGNFLRIDMEDSPCTTPTLEIHNTLRREFPDGVGAVLQSRLRRTLDDTDTLTREPANIRLCKGIYNEPREIAFVDPEIIRRSFVAALELMFKRDAYVGIATHDERLVWESLHLVHQYSRRKDQYEFQMLLGVDEQLRRILLDAGHRLRVYVPYGEQWYKYSVRRLKENPQIAGHAFRAMFRRRPPRDRRPSALRATQNRP